MFVIPMVGLSSRFFNEGYSVPKYQLPLHDTTVFSAVISSFSHYFESDEFLFLCRSDHGADVFVNDELRRIGVKNYRIVMFDENTRGQAETVKLGTVGVSSEEELYIFNIDTIRPNFMKAEFPEDVDGYLEVFVADGDHWSFVSPGRGNEVIRTTEKQRISNLCSDGLYYFKRKADFDEAFIEMVDEGGTRNGEYYVAPMYNYLIRKEKKIRYSLVAAEEVILCGTPVEYRQLLAT